MTTRRKPSATNLPPSRATNHGSSAARSRLTLDGFSLEMTGNDIADLIEAKDVIPRGTKINITYLGNEDLEMRASAAGVVRSLGFVPVPHISARRLRSREQLEEFLGRLRDVGATEHVLVVGGDPAKPAGLYEDSLDVIRSGILPSYGVREVSIAGYPDGHPDISSNKLWTSFEDKSASLKDQGLDSVLATQFSFDAAAVISWINEVRTRGVESPIRVGTPGPAGIKRLLNFARRFGVGANAMVVKKYGFSLTNLMGTAGPDTFISDLSKLLTSEHGDIKLHFYTFGGLLATAKWAHKYSEMHS